jgi:hypothetical protein
MSQERALSVYYRKDHFRMRRFLFWLLLLLIFLVACSTNIDTNPIQTPSDYTNQQIKLRTFDYDNSYKTSDSISAEIWNYSGKFITFPNNYNIRIFERTKTGWEEISERPVTRLPSGDFTFNPNDGSSNIAMIDIFPDFPKLDRKYDLRIYVTGKMDENKINVDVTAYTDITLKP